MLSSSHAARTAGYFLPSPRVLWVFQQRLSSEIHHDSRSEPPVPGDKLVRQIIPFGNHGKVLEQVVFDHRAHAVDIAALSLSRNA